MEHCVSQFTEYKFLSFHHVKAVRLFLFMALQNAIFCSGDNKIFVLIIFQDLGEVGHDLDPDIGHGLRGRGHVGGPGHTEGHDLDVGQGQRLGRNQNLCKYCVTNLV